MCKMRISCNIYALGFTFKIENLLDIGVSMCSAEKDERGNRTCVGEGLRERAVLRRLPAAGELLA